MKNKTICSAIAAILAVGIIFPTCSLAVEGEETGSSEPSAVSSEPTETAPATEAEPTEPTETQSANHEGVAAFVARIYTTALEREYDQDGLNYWCGELEGGKATGLDIFKRITDCPEFTNKELTNEEYLNVLYKTFFDREPDVDGLVYWLNALVVEDYSRDFVLSCFADSAEWTKICEGYGILPGNTPKQEVPTQPQTNEKTEGFVKRLYQYCMGREADEEGLKYWCDQLSSRAIGGRDAAYGFFSSEEFRGIAQTLDKPSLIKVFYTVFLDRVPSDQEVSEWTELISMGNEVAILYNGFSGSYEFADICSSADIYLGDFKPMEVIQNDPEFYKFLEWNLQPGIERLSNAVLTPQRTYKFMNIQGGDRNVEIREIPEADIKAIEQFAATHFEPTWSPAQKVTFTLYWIHNNVEYDFWGKSSDSFAVSIFVNKVGQCAQYNGALIEMMCYLGFDACLVQGYRSQSGGRGYQHFWGECYVNGETLVMEAGNTKDGNWYYFAVPYSETKKYIH